MRQQHGLRFLGLSLIVAGAGLLAWLGWMALRPESLAIADSRDGQRVAFTAERARVLLPGQCVSVTWEAEGISAIYLDHEGIGGEGSASICPAGAYYPTFRVVAPDGSSHIYTLPVSIVVYQVEFWILLIFGTACALSGVILYNAGRQRQGRAVLLARIVFALVGGSLLLLLAHFVVDPGPVVVQQMYGQTALYFRAERRWTAFSEGCVPVEWELEGIKEAYLVTRSRGIQGVTGREQRTLCGYDQAHLEVTLSDNAVVTLPGVGTLFADLRFWLLLVAAVSLIRLDLTWRGVDILYRKVSQPGRPVLPAERRLEVRAVLRVLAKAFALFLALNVLFFILQPLPVLGRLSLYNALFPGRERLPMSNYPDQAYNLTTTNLEAMFSAHEIAAPKATDEFRVLLLGDSAIWGWFLRPEETLAGQLNALELKTTDGRRVHVYNLGYPQPSLGKDLLFLDYAMRYEPDLILLPVALYSLRHDQIAPVQAGYPATLQRLNETYGLNIPVAAEPPTVQSLLHQTLVGSRKVLNELFRLQLYSVMWWATGIDQRYLAHIQREIEREETFDISSVVEDIDTAGFSIINAIIERAGGVPVVVINVPIFITPFEEANPGYYNFFSAREVYNEYRDMMAAAAEEYHWNYIDLWQAIQPEEFTDSQLHYSPAGARQYRDALIGPLRGYIP